MMMMLMRYPLIQVGTTGLRGTECHDTPGCEIGKIWQDALLTLKGLRVECELTTRGSVDGSRRMKVVDMSSCLSLVEDLGPCLVIFFLALF